MIIIVTLHFNAYADFAYNISYKYGKLKDLGSVDIVAKYEDAKEIIRELCSLGYGIANINLEEPEWDGYEDEFVISLYDCEIWCEPIKRNNEYIYVEAEVVYILDDCNSKIIPFIESDEIYEVGIGDCEYDCNDCELFDTSITSYTVNGKEVDKEEYEKKSKEIDEIFTNHIKTVLKDYTDFINEMKNWKNLLD